MADSSGGPQFGERAAYGPNDHCYRHPDRQSFTLCQRCGKTICPDCQTASSVGVFCPDCVKAHSATRAQRASRSLRVGGRVLAGSSTPVVTYTIMAMCAVVFVGQMLLHEVTTTLWYSPVYSLPQQFEPWRMVTAMFTHSTSAIFHILFNMYALWLFGRQLEHFLGRLYFIVLYVFAGVGGSLAVMFWGYTGMDALRTATVGASGAIFGILAAMLVAMRASQVNVRSLAVLIAINFAIGFIPGVNISWQAHLGGMIVGAATMAVLLKFRGPRQRSKRIIALVLLGAVLVALSFAYFFVNPLFLFPPVTVLQG